MLEEQMIIRKNEQYLKITKEVIKHFLSKEKNKTYIFVLLILFLLYLPCIRYIVNT